MLKGFSSVRARLLGLALLAVVPLIALFGWNAWQVREQAIAGAKDELARGARFLAEDIANDVRAAHQLLHALGAHPDVRAGREPGCGMVLRAQKAQATLYTDFFVFDAGSGLPLCHSVAGTPPARPATDRDYFVQALASRKPVVGRPITSRADGRRVLPVAVPILAESGAVERVLATGFDLAWLGERKALAYAVAGAAFTVWEADGTIAYRYPENDKWAGKRFADIDLVKRMRNPGAHEARGADGVLRVYGFATLEEFPGANIYLSLGESRDELTATANSVFIRSLSGLAFIVAGVLALGWLVAERYLSRPLAALDQAQQRLAGGDLTVRVPAQGVEGEVGRLLDGFNRTVAALEAKDSELRALMADLEQRVAERTAQLERANEMKSQFLATMSHELRTPLNAIIGFAEVLKDGLAGSLNEEQKTFAGDIHASGRHLLSLINDILDLSKVEAGMMTLEPEPVELAALLHGGLTMVKEKAMKQRVALDLEVEPGLPVFAADARKLKQIVFNLLSNAVKFTPEGGRVRVSARRVPRAGVALPAGRHGRMEPLPAGEESEFVEIAVSDSGIGIGAGDLERLFQPFVQIDSALGRRQQGTGLGLALVKRLAGLHEGAVGVSSSPGQGSTFLVWLPLAEARARPAAARAAAPAQHAQGAQPLALVVEDDDAAAEMIERALRAEGFRCRRASTAEEALVRAAKERPDLVTLDIFLPHMDGWDFMARLKGDPALAGVPVVIVSVAANLEHGLALGATRILQKPFSQGELRAALAGLVPMVVAGAPCTVLIVDDNPQAVELLAGHLNNGNYRLLRAYGGREAIETVGRSRPDLILLDLLMPELSGFDVVEHLKADPATARIPIVVVTAKDLSAEDRAALDGSVQRILAKGGLRTEDFIAEVRRALQHPYPRG